MRGRASGLDLTGTDGAVEVLAVDGDDVTIGIVNPDGSRAEMSGNGTRIAAAWLMSRTGSSASARPRRPAHRGRAADGGRSLRVGSRGGRGRAARDRRRHRADAGLGRQSARGRHGRPEPDRRARPAARDASALSGADERAGRTRRPARRGDRTRLGARGGGDERIRERAPSRSRPRPMATARSSSTSPAATCACA